MGIFRLISKKEWTQIPLAEIKKRARILVIDDQDFYYKTLFDKDGYNLDKWNDIDDLEKLESGYYDIILLDIQGVGRSLTSFSQEQGFGVLKHIRKVNPSQIVIAYSNSDNYSLKYKDFFQMADSVLDKRQDYIDFKEAVDKLLQERFSLGFYIRRIDQIATPYSVDSQKLETQARKAILRNKSNKLSEFLRDNINNADAIKAILEVASVAIQIGLKIRQL